MITRIKDAVSGKVPLSSKRSTRWPKVRAKHLESHPVCACCEGSKDLSVHHIHPFHLYPNLELEPDNLVTLCESKKNGINCHLLLGHLGNFKNVNPDVIADVAVWNVKLKPDNCNHDRLDVTS